MIEQSLEWVAIAADGVAIIVIVLGFVNAVVKFVPSIWKAGGVEVIRDIQMIRCNLGTYLVFGLELMIVSDLIQSVISHSLDDLYFLGAIVVLRTVIGFFLSKEIQEISHS